MSRAKRELEAWTTILKGIEAMVEITKEKTDLAECPPTEDIPQVPEPAAPASDTDEAGESGLDEITEAELLEMKYNDLKKVAKLYGVEGKGTKATIIENILSAANDGVSPEPETEEPEHSNVTPISKAKKKKEKSEVEPEEPEEEDEEDEEIEVEFTEEEAKEAANEAYKDSGKDTIIAVLTELEMLPKKSTPASLRKALTKAILEGKVNFADDEEGEETESEVSEDSDMTVVDIDPLEYFEDYDIYELNNPKEMEPERKEAIDNWSSALSLEMTNEELERRLEALQTLVPEDILADLFEDPDDLDPTEVVKAFIEVNKYLVDDEGNQISLEDKPEPYYIGEEILCCGRVVDIDEERGVALCSSCGSEYELED